MIYGYLCSWRAVRNDCAGAGACRAHGPGGGGVILMGTTNGTNGKKSSVVGARFRARKSTRFLLKMRLLKGMWFLPTLFHILN